MQPFIIEMATFRTVRTKLSYRNIAGQCKTAAM